jgi:hypothetical protein
MHIKLLDADRVAADRGQHTNRFQVCQFSISSRVRLSRTSKETKWTNDIVTMVKVDETEVYSDLTLHDQEDECDVWLVSATQGHCVG